jgi:hypothetical protein
MHLAALSLSAGNAREAMRWVGRAGVWLPLILAPFVVRVTLSRRIPARTFVMRPGEPLDLARLPRAKVPYHSILTALTALSRWFGPQAGQGNR